MATEHDDAGVVDHSGDSADSSVENAPALLPIIWADPEHLPEHLALFAVKHFGRRAASGVVKLREQNPNASKDDLMDAAIDRAVRITMSEGALMGGPIVLLVPVAFVAAALAQAHMVLEIAGLNDRRPTDRVRAADLLVIQAAYPSTDDAAEGLDKIKTDPHDHAGKRLPRGTRVAMIRRMAFLLGLIDPPTGKKPGRVRRALSWVGIATFVVIGFLLPLIWMPAMAAMFLKSTRQLGSRATVFYSAPSGGDAEVEVKVAGDSRVRPVRLVFFLRTLLVALLPLIAALGLLIAGIRFLGDKWSSAVVVLIGVSALSTIVWSGYRWWRYRDRQRSH